MILFIIMDLFLEKYINNLIVMVDYFLTKE